MTFYKITNQEEIHHGLQYKTGLNIDPEEWNPHGSCRPGGIYFSDAKHIMFFLDHGVWIREVTIPEGTPIYEDPEGDKLKSPQIVLGKRRSLKKASTWRWMVEQGIDITIDNGYALVHACSYGYLSIVKILVRHGVDIHRDDDWALRMASSQGKLRVVKYLIKQGGCDLDARSGYALGWAAYNNHLNIVRYLIRQGADPRVNDYAPLRLVSIVMQKKIMDYFKRFN